MRKKTMILCEAIDMVCKINKTTVCCASCQDFNACDSVYNWAYTDADCENKKGLEGDTHDKQRSV